MRSFPTTAGAACVDGLCPPPNPALTKADRWLDPTFTGWVNATTATGQAPTQYFIEYMGEFKKPGCAGIPAPPQCMKPRYRITARTADTSTAQVMLQTNYAIN